MLIKKCVVLFSGKGTNLKNLLENQSQLNGKLQYVAAFTDNPDAPGIKICNDNNLTVIVGHGSNLENDLLDFLAKQSPDIVVLAGYMKIIPANIVKEYKSKIINIHPSLLPKYPGLNTYNKVLKNKDQFHGATVHFVTETLDGGPIILQGKFQISEKITLTDLESLTHRIEYKIFPIVIGWIANDIIAADGEHIRFKSKIVESPITYLMKNEYL